MEYEQFCLKWNNFQSSILKAFKSLQSTEELADVTLACDGTTIKAHKFILSACSPYFRNIFKENPCPHPVVILRDVLQPDLISLLNFVYHGEVMVTKEQLPTFLKTAEALQISGLKSLPDLYPKKKAKRSVCVPDIEHETTKKKTKTNKDEEKLLTEPPELINIDNIKVEHEEELTEHNGAENKGGRGSLLEAALEVREPAVSAPQSSILEKTLTLSTGKSPDDTNHNEPTNSRTEKKLSDNLLKQEVIDYESCNNSDNQNNESPQILPISEAPIHHSSQCGNCPHCGLPYSNQSSLKYHVRLVHSELLNLYCCHLCPLTFGYRDSYKKHMADAHSVRS